MGKKNRMVGLVFPFFQSTTKRFCGDSVVQLIAKVLCVDLLRLPDRVYSFFPNNTKSKVQKKTQPPTETHQDGRVTGESAFVALD